MNKPIGQDSSLNISLPMIIQIVGFITAMVWGYGQLTTRITFVENESKRNTQTIDEMKALQDAPIPSDVRQDELLKMMDARINEIKEDIEYFKREMYNK